jgi:hypothetical protein
MNSREAFRKTMQLANTGRPVFVPIVYRLAARIEQTLFMDMVSDPTTLTNVLDGAYKLLRQDGIVTNFDATLEAEFFGCPVDFPGDYDPPTADWSSCDVKVANINNSWRLPVMLEAIKRLVQTRGREAAIIGTVIGPCSLAAKLGEVSDTTISSVSDIVVKLTRSICETKVDALIIREDLLDDRFYGVFAAYEKAATTAYVTLLNLTRFYNVAGLLMVQSQKLDELAALARKLAPAGLILSGQKLGQDDLAYLKDLSTSQKLAVGLPLPLADLQALAEQFKTCEEFINVSQSGGFFYTSDGEVPPYISLEGLREISGKIKGVQVS